MGVTPRHVKARIGERGRHRAVQRDAWLSKHGARYGLCRIYRTEPWHYELRRQAINRGCPRMHEDSTQDPRMQQ
jgi:D-alanyl-D-alanine carboxypeptidase